MPAGAAAGPRDHERAAPDAQRKNVGEDDGEVHTDAYDELRRFELGMRAARPARPDHLLGGVVVPINHLRAERIDAGE